MESGLTFVVRVYRHSVRGMQGVVEDVRTGLRIAFDSEKQLWAALRAQTRSKPAAASGRKRR